MKARYWGICIGVLLVGCRFIFNDNGNVKIQLIGGGYWHSVVVDTDDNVWTSGANWYGQLGDGSIKNRENPVKIDRINGIKSIACGSTHTLILKSDGTVWAWGNNASGQLGDGTSLDRHRPVEIKGISDVESIDCGECFSIAVKRDGTVWTWGDNTSGQLGDGTTESKNHPIEVRGISNVYSVACGSAHCLAEKEDGTLWTWGNNSCGQFGNGTQVSQSVPMIVPFQQEVSSVDCGNEFSIALTKEGEVYGWGSNGNGQLGMNNNKIYLEATKIPNMTEIKAISCGYSHVIAITRDNTMIAWGGGTFLGDGSTAGTNSPIKIKKLVNVISICAENNFSMAVTKDNRVWAWGRNWKGQLGSRTNCCTIPIEYFGEYKKSIINVKAKTDAEVMVNENMNDSKLRNHIIEKSNKDAFQAIGFFSAMDKSRSKGECLVGVLDTGIDINHRDLHSKIFVNSKEIPGDEKDNDGNGYIDDTNGWNFYNDSRRVFDSGLDDSHGTEVSGILATINPTATILPLKITETNQQINDIRLIMAIEYAENMGVSIMNCSFGTSEFNKALFDKIRDSNILFICSAGNFKEDVAQSPIYPACYASNNIISVAAIDKAGKLYRFSNYGKAIDIAAPGVNIYTTSPNNRYTLCSGTSIAAAFVTGIASLTKCNHPEMDQKEVRATIISHAKILKASNLPFGIVDADNSLKH